jgi:hypothetical protein
MLEDHAFRRMRLTGAYIISSAGGFSTCICHKFRCLLQFRQAVPAIHNRQQIIHLHKKNIAYPTERSKMLMHFLARGKDMRFSMKMMFAPNPETPMKPV